MHSNVTAVAEISMEQTYLDSIVGQIGGLEIMEGRPTDFEGAVEILLRPSCRKFLVHLRTRVRENPTFMYHYEHSIGVKVQRVLYRHGIRWSSETMFTNWARVLRVAMVRLEEQVYCK